MTKYIILIVILVVFLLATLLYCLRSARGGTRTGEEDLPLTEEKEEPTSSDNFVVDMYERVYKKCNYGEEMETLSPYERVFYITQELEGEVNNGGFSQFFFNSSGNFSGEIVQAFTEIGAHETAAICKRALAAFGCALPADRDAREELLDSLDWDSINPILSECDSDFYAYPDDLNALNQAYIQKHIEYFK